MSARLPLFSACLRVFARTIPSATHSSAGRNKNPHFRRDRPRSLATSVVRAAKCPARKCPPWPPATNRYKCYTIIVIVEVSLCKVGHLRFDVQQLHQQHLGFHRDLPRPVVALKAHLQNRVSFLLYSNAHPIYAYHVIDQLLVHGPLPDPRHFLLASQIPVNPNWLPACTFSTVVCTCLGELLSDPCQLPDND
jgi:hypothetical protein